MEKMWQKIVSLAVFRKKNRLPEVPGVYFFLDAKRKLLYIGKATSLRDRVKSYFTSDLMVTRGPKVARMLEQVRFIGYRTTDSVLEALILETNLIKQHQPPYNTDAKDDKSYNYVVITREQFPRVLLMRERDILKSHQITANNKQKEEYKYIFGPFPHGMQLREAMKIVRHLFPYRDKCVPVSSEQKTVNKKQGTEDEKKAPRQAQGMAVQARPCFNRQIGLCPGVCTGEITAPEYAKTIRNIRLLFSGKKGRIIKQLKQEMKMAAKHLQFERANEIKKTLFGLQHIEDIALMKDSEQRTMNSEYDMRIEAYDVAHLGGQASVGVMTVVEHGTVNKDAYRMFRLRKKHGGNDLSALEEMITRRLTHLEWGVPDIVVVDGALLQLGVAEELFAGVQRIRPLIVGVVKDEHHRPKHILNLPSGFTALGKDILLANSEAHRFAISYHRRRRSREFLKV